ncbi:uncharacterized protein LOC128509878 [Clarias gariepinus]|uniref:uncharacterized protein LOC128509878 n=1 Tax=Clarias gariepinus TaxID=13013 RepID=UPI00234DA9D2|nr:uncharacterized protein LOC128509878 [Clarias gariepinus]XP_053337724.1 uncharacterized protein LOC128509878 [Clarias gariepinus]
MQSCSVHHCVLFLLTLTLNTDPGSAAVFPIYATLHRPVTLPCEAQCSGRATWSLDSNRDDVFAQCDQTSCTSVKEGYEMSYDQFKKGDLSLTITKPDYSMRKTYTCECDYSDVITVNLRIFTVFSAVQVKTGEDLKLDVSVPEPVEVIYRSRDSADDVQICNVTQRSLQCKSEYTPRTSLSYPELTLRHMERSESGTYIIRNLNFKEDIRVYAVSVSAEYSVYSGVKSCLQRIDTWCRTNKEEQNNCMQQASGRVENITQVQNMVTFLGELEQCCKDKKNELKKYMGI